MTEQTRDDNQDLNVQHDAEKMRQARREFFARPLTDDYAVVWTELLAKKKQQFRSEGEPVVIFRVEEQWLALPAGMVKIILEPHKPHKLPHRAGILRGLVNVEGELTLCVSLQELFKLESQASPQAAQTKKSVARMIVINDGKYSWAFAVDEIHGVSSIEKNKIIDTPVTLSKSPTKLTRGLFHHHDREVGLIDGELLLGALQRSLS